MMVEKNCWKNQLHNYRYSRKGGRVGTAPSKLLLVRRLKKSEKKINTGYFVTFPLMIEGDVVYFQ